MHYHFELSSDYFDCTVPNLENNDRRNHIIGGGGGGGTTGPGK